MKDVGIVGYGAYIPKNRIKTEEIAAAHGHNFKKIYAAISVDEKSVASADEDSATMAVQAAQIALEQAKLNANKLGALYIASESHPYAVKPTSSIVGEALGVGSNYMTADMEFACKGGTAAMQVAAAQVKSGYAEYAMCIGTDVSQASPADILEYTASAASAAFMFGTNSKEFLATLECTTSFTTDTPDFWRRQNQKYPEHTGRFTGEPAYFYHVIQATQKLLSEASLKVSDIDHVVFHQPNGKFPVLAAKELGFSAEQIKNGLLVNKIGNSYSACSFVGFCAVLDIAKPGQRILLVSYGSGSGSDAFIFTTTNLLAKKQKSSKTLTVANYLENKHYVTYMQYKKCIGLVI